MKKILITLFLFVLFVCAIWVDSEARPTPVLTLNSSQEVANGQNTTRSWYWTDTIFGSADACTSGWMQSGYDVTSTTPDSNKMATQVGATWFAVYCKTVLYETNDSGTISSGRVQYALTSNPSVLDIYEAADSTRFFIGSGDIKVQAGSPRAYPVYLLSARHFRLIISSTVDDTFIFYNTTDGAHN